MLTPQQLSTEFILGLGGISTGSNMNAIGLASRPQQVPIYQPPCEPTPPLYTPIGPIPDPAPAQRTSAKRATRPAPKRREKSPAQLHAEAMRKQIASKAGDFLPPFVMGGGFLAITIALVMPADLRKELLASPMLAAIGMSITVAMAMIFIVPNICAEAKDAREKFAERKLLHALSAATATAFNEVYFATVIAVGLFAGLGFLFS